MISTTKGGVVINFSDRFTLSGMTGNFPPAVQTAVKSVKDTKGPETENQVQDAAKDAADGGGDGTPYSAQTGPTKYAPMQKKPGTKITAKSAKPLYPTSSAQVAKTALPPPKQLTTMTQTATYQVSSRENTVRIPCPTNNDLQLTSGRPLHYQAQAMLCRSFSTDGETEIYQSTLS